LHGYRFHPVLWGSSEKPLFAYGTTKIFPNLRMSIFLHLKPYPDWWWEFMRPFPGIFINSWKTCRFPPGAWVCRGTAPHSAANTAINQEPLGHYRIAAFITVMIRFQTLRQVRAHGIHNRPHFEAFLGVNIREKGSRCENRVGSITLRGNAPNSLIPECPPVSSLKKRI
jgi:hypothetical protein